MKKGNVLQESKVDPLLAEEPDAHTDDDDDGLAGIHRASSSSSSSAFFVFYLPSSG
jgi:hypothetical protein